MLWEEVEGSVSSLPKVYINTTTNYLLWAGPEATFVAYNATINI